MTRYTPEIGTRIIPETIKEKTVAGITNSPPPDTLMRATLGNTVLVGRVSESQIGQNHAVIILNIEPVEGTPAHMAGYLSGFNCWAAVGWEFEILDAEVAA